MKKYLVTILALLIYKSVFGQVNDSIPPAVELKFNTPKNYSGILYRFPENISNLINSKLESSKNDAFNFIRIGSSSDTIILTIYSIGKIEKSVARSNRHYYYKNKLIPIVFDIDFIFSDFNFAITEGAWQIKFIKAQWHDSFTKILKIE